MTCACQPRSEVGRRQQRHCPSLSGFQVYLIAKLWRLGFSGLCGLCFPDLPGKGLQILSKLFALPPPCSFLPSVSFTSALSATPATQNEGGCRQVPRLPRETKVDVTNATPVTGEVPRLPCETKVDVTSGYVTKCHVCQAKCRGVTSNQSAPPEPTRCPKDHACHAKRRWMSPRSTPAT